MCYSERTKRKKQELFKTKSIVTTKKAIKPLLEVNMSSPNTIYDGVSIQKKDYDTDDSQKLAPGKLKSLSPNLLKRHSKKDFYDEEISELHYASKHPLTQTPSRRDGLRNTSPVKTKRQ